MYMRAPGVPKVKLVLDFSDNAFCAAVDEPPVPVICSVI
jgi:hypothetical protein